MLFLRLEHIDLLLNATSILTQSSNNADLRISPSKLSIITFNNSHRFFATFQILPESFVDYFVDRNHGFMMFIHSFRNAMLEGRIYPFMRIRLKENTSRIVLTFETPNYVPLMDRELEYFHPEREDMRQVDEAKFFSIGSQDFRRIITGLYIPYHGSIHITLTDSQVRFYIPTNEIILTKERGQCEIIGYEGEVETQFRISLRPKKFFIDLSHQASRVWFFKTTDSHSSVICIPVLGFDARYLIYFPQT